MTLADEIAAAIAELRPVHDDAALPDTVEVWREVESRDSRNNPVMAPALVGEYRASIESANRAGASWLAGPITGQDRLYRITLPYDADVNATDELRTPAGRRFEVTEDIQPGGFGIALEVIAQEVAP